MLTDTEKRECDRLLRRLTNDELMSLKDTITKKQIAVETRNEAVKAIILYSQSGAELLRRKKLRRDILFQYLADCNVIVPPNSEKSELIRRILQYWGSPIPSDRDLMEIESGTEIAAGASQTEQPERTVQQNRDVGAAAATAASDNQHIPSATVARPISNASQNQVLGEAFVQWFYQQLNSLNPTQQQTGDFGPHHFWENCNLKLVSQTQQVTEDHYEGSLLVVQRLSALVREELLLFNPNVSPEGVKVRSDPHGLLIVMVCGTIHQHNNLLGVFRQMFGLARNPRGDDKWKVKTTELQLCSGRERTIPRLTDFPSGGGDDLSMVPRH